TALSAVSGWASSSPTLAATRCSSSALAMRWSGWPSGGGKARRPPASLNEAQPAKARARATPRGGGDRDFMGKAREKERHASATGATAQASSILGGFSMPAAGTLACAAGTVGTVTGAMAAGSMRSSVWVIATAWQQQAPEPHLPTVLLASLPAWWA